MRSQYSTAPLLHDSSIPFHFAVAALSWVKPAMHFFESSAINVGIDLRRRNVRMTQHRLNRPEVGAPFKKMGREGMPKRVRRHSLIYGGGQSIAAD